MQGLLFFVDDNRSMFLSYHIRGPMISITGEARMAELRRNPITRKWIIYQPNGSLETLLQSSRKLESDPTALYPSEPQDCPYCPGAHNEDSTHIMAVQKGRSSYLRGSPVNGGWDVLVRSAGKPIFRIEDELKRKGRRLYDTMGSPGAHEILITTPDHGKSFQELETSQIQLCLRVLKERMIDLDRDVRLGHLFAYMAHGSKCGSTYNHALFNLIASPFIPEKIQKELSGAHDWYKIKERCLFCDIIEEEKINQERQKSHGILDETTHFIAFIPFFAGHPFEIWIQPVEHVSDYVLIPEDYASELAFIIKRVLDRLMRAIGPFPFIMLWMNRPNIRWGASRGYWDAIENDWHWRIRILPESNTYQIHDRSFFLGTGSRINPVLPETAAEFLRRC